MSYMSYVTSLSGDLSIDPPLTYAELRDSPWVAFVHREPGKREEWRSLRVVQEESTKDTDEGLMIVKTACRVVPFDLGDGRHSPEDVADDVSALFDAFPGHTFTGRIDFEGERNGDLARIIVDRIHGANNVRIVRAEIRWPA